VTLHYAMRNFPRKTVISSAAFRWHRHSCLRELSVNAALISLCAYKFNLNYEAIPKIVR
jgi:hypothetical protein